ncbi:MAG TPA: TIGR02265 family protein [Thermoanaerobaculia bacterium]|nr:TIGR02265 family protein [Thermoanaerobaculia bacterium]
MRDPLEQGKVKGGGLQARLEFVRERSGDAAVERVLSKLSEEDRKICRQPLAGMWYPFALNERLDDAIADEMGMGDRVFELMGEKSASHNLTSAHRLYVATHDPHALLRRAPQIYQMYYDTGRRTYESLGETKAVLRTYDAETFSKHDCLTIVGWHRRAIEMCGGKNVRVTETKCRARGADVCEYVCEWT